MLALGCDLGALATKTVLLMDGQIAAFDITPNQGHLADVAEISLAKVLSRAGLKPESVPVRGGMGWGVKYIKYPHRPDTIINCLAAGALWLRPTARTVVDLGGLSTTVISMNEQGKVLEYRSNDRCASGTGFFIELVAQALEMDLAEMDLAAQSASGRAHIGAQCAVFGESEVVSHVNDGVDTADIAAGVSYALGVAAATSVRRLGIVPEVLASGGVSKMSTVLAALSEKLAVEIIRPVVEPQLVGAIGAALAAFRHSVSPPRT